MQILDVRAFLQSRIMLLKAVSIHRIIQKERKVRIEVEKRAACKCIGLENVSMIVIAPVVKPGGSRPDPASVRRVHITETIQPARSHFVERDLTGRIEPVDS